MNVLEGLNPEQEQAVKHFKGPLLILAGAGSGKTRVLTHRIAYLIEEYGVNPWNILAITFTNKAAGEMRERVDNIVTSGAEYIWVSTFHSACVRILRRHIEALGYSRSFTIYDADDQRTLMRDILKYLQLDPKKFKERSVLGAISSAKDEMITPEEYERRAAGDYLKEIYARAYREYEKRLRDSNALDFDDLIVKTIQLLQDNPEILDYYQNRFRYIMVDEYQDTNTAQFELVRLLADSTGEDGRREQNLCVVGDDDQSIYRFRGATIENILNFERIFPGTKTIRLEQNYRSTSNILNAANCVIQHNTERKGKTLWTDNGEGDKVVTDHFEVVEQVHDCRVLFEQLQSSLSSTWDHYFSEASIYYAENGNLDIPRRYKTPMGLSLGAWLQMQRQIRSGKCTGSLTEQQIERLDSIGMRWDSYNDLAWTRGLAAAEQYYAKHGDLLVPVGWVTDDGFLLGTWVCNRRAEKAAGKLDDDKIEELENIGMVWDAFSEKWERGFAAAAQYYAEHGNLVMPVSYTTKNGLRLGVWVRNQKQTYANGTLQQEKAARLEDIGIRWKQNNYDFQWSEAYAAAKRYFEEYGSLNVPIAYTTADGIALGKWVARQQYARNNPGKSNCKLTPERVALLDKIGMQWEKPDPWQHRYELAQDYLQEHGNLLIPAKYKTDDGIWLGRWLYEQKVLLRKQSPKLNADKIDKLRKLLGEELAEKVG